MLTEAESDLLLVAVNEAVELAARGEAAAGYECLVTARQHAKDASEWNQEIELLWQRALDHYASRNAVGRA